MPENNKKYLICPVCFSLYHLDKQDEDGIIECEHCEDCEVLPLEDFIYHSSPSSLDELKEDFKRSSHLDPDVKDLIIGNIRILIQLLEEVKKEH